MTRKKKCARCRNWKDCENFKPYERNRCGLTSYCRSCINDAWKEWNRRHPGVKREQSKASLAKVINEAITAYGGKCSCCGESERMFLTMDHVMNDGGGRKRKGNIYFIARREKFPSTYQILCFNCNLGKHRNGGTCPHIKDKYL